MSLDLIVNCRYNRTMSMQQIKDRMARELVIGGHGVQNLLSVIITSAILLMGHVHMHGNVESLGADFARGHGVLLGKLDLPLASFDHAVTIGGVEKAYLDSLCASTGAVNLGIHSGHIYIMQKWLVSVYHVYPCYRIEEDE